MALFPPTLLTQMANNLAHLESIISQLNDQIGEETQFDQVTNLVEQIGEQVQNYSTLLPIFNRFLLETYRSKGAMCEVRGELEELLDQCFQLRLYHLLVDGV